MDGSVRAIKWCAWGIIPMLFLGLLWRQLYAWGAGWHWIGFFAPVSGSVWEAEKAGYWPLVLWWMLGLRLIFPKKQTMHGQAAWRARGYGRWMVGLSVAVTIALTTYPALLYTYRGAVGAENEAVLAGLLLASFTAGQWAGSRVFRYISVAGGKRLMALIVVVLVGLLLMVWSYTPPGLPLFAAV